MPAVSTLPGQLPRPDDVPRNGPGTRTTPGAAHGVAADPPGTCLARVASAQSDGSLDGSQLETPSQWNRNASTQEFTALATVLHRDSDWNHVPSFEHPHPQRNEAVRPQHGVGNQGHAGRIGYGVEIEAHTRCSFAFSQY